MRNKMIMNACTVQPCTYERACIMHLLEWLNAFMMGIGVDLLEIFGGASLPTKRTFLSVFFANEPWTKA
jgi:hypothetical protein